MPNIDGISGAFFTLRIRLEYIQTQFDEGARDGIDIWFMLIIFSRGFWRIASLSWILNRTPFHLMLFDVA